MDPARHEMTDDHARLRSAKGVGPYVEFLRTPGDVPWTVLTGPGQRVLRPGPH
jgi:hypothetical protein